MSSIEDTPEEVTPPLTKVEDIASEQIDAIIGTLDKTLAVQFAVEEQVVMTPPKENPRYQVPEQKLAVKYCMAKMSGFASPEHTPEWVAEWDSLFNQAVEFYSNVNNILKS